MRLIIAFALCRVGFVHPYAGVIDVEGSNLKILLRDFDISGLDAGPDLC